ncbi:hypothetical protein ACFSQ7_43390 [Paenibacillus rhizoplanae]
MKLYAALKDGDTYKGFILDVNGKKSNASTGTYPETTRTRLSSSMPM